MGDGAGRLRRGPRRLGAGAGLGHKAAISHLAGPGVTAIELLPVHESVPEAFLPARGLTDYWGYNTIGYFAPHQGYSTAVRAGHPGGQVAEFKAMVDALHGAGLEVPLDVVNTDQRTARYAGAPQKYHATVSRARFSRRRCRRAGPGRRG